MNEIENIQKRTLRFVLNDTQPVSLITTILNQYKNSWLAASKLVPMNLSINFHYTFQCHVLRVK